MPAFTLPPTSVLFAQTVAALLWIAAYVIWARVYYAFVDPMLRRRLGAWVNGDVIWLYRRGSLYASPASFTLRRSTWSWGLAGDRENAPLRDGAVYAAYVITVPVFAGLWLIALVSYAALWRHMLSAVIVLPLFFLIIPLYMRYWGGRHPAPGMQLPVDDQQPLERTRMNGTLAIALLLLMAPSVALSAQQAESIPGLQEYFVRAPRPKTPVVKPGACPFECCHYGKWKLKDAAAVRRRPNDSAPRVFGLNRGQAVLADSGFVQIDTVGLVVLRQSHADAMYHTPYAKGDTLLVLDYIGEGQYNAWWRGYSIQTESFWDSLGQTPRPETVGSVVRQMTMRWWARVRDARGRRGWIDMDKVGVSGADACG